MVDTRVGTSTDAAPAAAGRRPDLLTALATALVGAILVLIQTHRYGAAATPDSVAYFLGARHLAEYGYLAYYDTMPFTGWPPLYPATLAAFAWVGLDPVRVAPYLNALLILGILGVTDAWIVGRLAHPTLRWLGRGLLVTSPPLLMVGRFALSEALFILLVMLALLFLDQWCAGGGPWGLVASAGMWGLASLTRYIGPSLMLAGVLVVVTARGPASGRRKLSGLILGMLSVLPLAGWMIRNQALEGALTGTARRPPTLALVLAGPGEICTAVAGWLTPFDLGQPLAVLISLGLAVLLVRFVLGTAMTEEHGRKARILACFIATYLACLVGVASMRDPISDRFLSPVVVPLLCLILLAADRWLSAGGRVARLATVAALAGVLLFNVRTTFQVTRSTRAFGAGGYACRDWVEDSLIGHLREFPLQGTVICNDPYAYYYFTGRPCLIMGGATLRSQVVRAGRAGEPVHLVFFNNPLRAAGLGDATPAEANEALRLRSEYACTAGSMWLWSQPPAAPN